MTDTRPPPFFIADNLGLDLLNTLAVSVDLAWLKQAGLLPGNVFDAVRKRAVPV